MSEIMAEAAAAPVETSGRAPAMGSGLEYRAFARQLEGVSGYVVMVVASCYYPVGNWSISFEGSAEGGLRLMQEEPRFHYDLVEFITASWGSGSAFLPERPATVQVTDGYGAHTVTVEDWGG